MVLRLKKRERALYLIAAFVIAMLFTMPYFTKDLLPIEHDTHFHLSRIDGLAQAIAHGDLLPAMYPAKNNGFGYPNPLFYCDLFLYPYALLNLAGMPISVCYKVMILVNSMLAAYAVMCLLHRIGMKDSHAFLGALAYTFANYHITDVYVRGAVGEVQAMIFLPILLEGIYVLLYEQETKEWLLCALPLAALALTHNLTLLMGVMMCILFYLFRFNKLTTNTHKAIWKSVLFAFLLSAFFTIPMLEQLKANTYYVDIIGKSSNLEAEALSLHQYFTDMTIFGFSGHDLPFDQQMTLNVGYFLTFASIFYFFRKNKHPFVTTCAVLGMICILLPCKVVPWDHLSFLRIMQFPWRFLQMGMVFLVVPAVWACKDIKKEDIVTWSLCGILIIEGICHVTPVKDRTYGMTSDMTWSDVANGAICDPYYSATFKRIELAAGDYLPSNSPDFRTLEPVLMDQDHLPIDRELTRTYNELSFTGVQGEQIVMPLTWYKGYTVTCNGKKVECSPDMNSLVSFTVPEDGKIVCAYHSTPMRKACIALSVISLGFLVFTESKRKHKLI